MPLRVSRPHATAIQRLAARLLRKDGYSVYQLAGILSLSVAFVHGLGRGGENLKDTTLRELGATDNSPLFEQLVLEARVIANRRLALADVGPARGNLAKVA